MSSSVTRRVAASEAYRSAAAILFLTLITILGAWVFEFMGYTPCPLCLQQRYAYYAGIPLLFGGLILLGAGQRHWSALIFLAVALMFLANAGLGVYQSGAEWKFWPGPSTCGTDQGISGSAADMLKQLQNTIPIRCDEAAIRIFGLSLAGWNVVVSLLAVAGCLRAAFASERHVY